MSQAGFIFVVENVFTTGGWFDQVYDYRNSKIMRNISGDCFKGS